MHFTAPADKEIDWNEEAFVGIERFVNRFYRMVKDIDDRHPADLKRYFKKDDLSESQWELYIKLNQMINKITEDSEKMQFNTTIAAMMEYFNALNQVKRIDPEFYLYILQKSTQMIAPLAPHFAEELWEMFGYTESIFKSKWPIHDPDAVVSDMITIVVQVNGKVRDNLNVSIHLSKDELESMAYDSERVSKFIEGKKVIKVIYVPKRLINIVVK